MSQPIRTLARTLLVPAALAAVAFAGQSAASASTVSHYGAQPAAAAARTTIPQNANWVHVYSVNWVHFYAVPRVHF